MAKVPPSSKYDIGLVTLRRSTVAAGLVGATILTGWSAGATWMLLARDDLAGHLIQREVARQYVYEDRIASLKGEIDKLSSKQLVNQDTVEARIADLATRQAQLESRQAVVASLAEGLGSGVLASARPSRAPEPPQRPGGTVAIGPAVTGSVSSFAPTAKPMPVPDIPGLRRQGDRRPQQLGWDASGLAPAPRPGLGLRMERIEAGLGGVELAQVRTIGAIEDAATQSMRRLRSVVADLGLDGESLGLPKLPAGTGGPFVPATLKQTADAAAAFEQALKRLKPQLTAVEQLDGAIRRLPLHRPMPADFEQSSPFGVRLDPFTRTPAMHTGLDFRAEHGSSIRAAGAGRVVTADYQGGYGNMVEIDHGNGLTTRYAHMSHISVSEGQAVSAGTVVGRVGSTGRSTGPHLHYEVRVNGDALDPIRFLRAGQRYQAAFGPL